MTALTPIKLGHMDAPTPDQELAARAAAGHPAAFDEIVTRFAGRIYRLACRLTSESDAEDILQETFIQICRGIASFRGDSQLSTWIYRVATNVALAHRRTQARRPTESIESWMPTFDENDFHRGTPAELQVPAGIDELLDRKALAAKAREALALLPELYRDPFVLRDLEELPTAEVAVILGIEPATVRQRVHRARLMLRGCLTAMMGAKV